MSPEKICEVCGHPIELKPGKVQRRYHTPCKKWRNFLDAAVRAAREINPKPPHRQSTYIRQEATRAANRMAALAQPRDALGRFVATVWEPVSEQEEFPEHCDF